MDSATATAAANVTGVRQPHVSYWAEDKPAADLLPQVKYESPNQMELRDERSYMICDNNLNFATTVCSEDETEYSGNGTNYKKAKISRQDPLSHRIIEKRRRDRMNNCLADLSRLIPSEYLKKGRGRVEKTEIIEMAIKYLKHLQQLHVAPSEQYTLGYQECMSEAMRFLVEIEGHFPRDPICVRLLNHLQIHCDLSSQSRKLERPEEMDNGVSVGADVENSTDKVPDCYNDVKSIEVMDEHSHQQIYECNTDYNQQASDVDDQCKRKSSDPDLMSEKNLSDSNGSASYKYKTNIKLRFSQDLNRAFKKNQISAENRSSHSTRRTSVTSLENYSSSHSSPPSSNSDLQMQVTPPEMETVPERTASIQSLYYSRLDYNGKHQVSKIHNRLNDRNRNNNFNVPIFALHAKGSFYVPLTIHYNCLVPFLQNYNLLDVQTNSHSTALHPVTINVNFQSDIHGV